MKFVLPDWVTRTLFLFSCGTVVLFYGIAAGRNEWFPYPSLRDAMAAGSAVWEIVSRNESGPRAVETGPIVRQYVGPVETTDPLILVGGGEGLLESLNPNGGCIAWLMDRKANVKHFWKYDASMWDDLSTTDIVPGASRIYPVGVHMLDDGGLLVSFQGTDTWPFGIGMVRLDRDSNVVWLKENHAHHWFDVSPAGEIITPTVRVLDAPRRIADTAGLIRGVDGKILEDMVTVLSPDGEIIREISLLEVFDRSGLTGLYQGAFEQTISVDSMDPLHLNYIRIAGSSIADSYDWMTPDDLLISCRSINSIAILDMDTLTIKWLSAGTTQRQHGPIFRSADSILCFDNHGGTATLGGSRIAQISLQTRFAETVFPTKKFNSDTSVFSLSAGHLDLCADESKVLMAVSGQSRVLEIDLATRDVVWEYQHPGELYTAKYCYNTSFEMNGEGFGVSAFDAK